MCARVSWGTVPLHLIALIWLLQVFNLSPGDNSKTALATGWLSFPKLKSPEAFCAVCSFNREGALSLWEMCAWPFGPGVSKQVDLEWWSRSLISQILWFISFNFFFLRDVMKNLGYDMQRQFWNEPTNINRHCYDSWNEQYFSTCPSNHVVSMSCIPTCQQPQFRKFPEIFLYNTFYLILLFFVCVCNKAFCFTFCVVV